MKPDNLEITVETIQREYEHLISSLIIRIAALETENTNLKTTETHPDTP